MFSELKIPDNNIHIDWLEFTFKGDAVTFHLFMSRFGVPLEKFTDSMHGRYGYSKCLVFQSSFVLMGTTIEQQNRMGFHVCVPASSLSFFNMAVLFDSKFAELIKYTRLDFAFDVYGDSVPLGELSLINYIYQTVLSGNYMSHVRQENIVLIRNASGGSTLYVGSTQSDKRLRIYDKAAEQGEINYKWVRFEYQLRHDVAHQYRQAINDIEILQSAFASLFCSFFLLCDRGSTNVTTQRNLLPVWEAIYKLIPLSKEFKPQKVESKRHPFYKKLEWLIKQAAPTFCYFAEFYDSWDWIDYRELFAKFMMNHKEFLHYSRNEKGQLMYDDFEVTSDDFNFNDLL